jgi:hypothetical protein
MGEELSQDTWDGLLGHPSDEVTDFLNAIGNQKMFPQIPLRFEEQAGKTVGDGR